MPIASYPDATLAQQNIAKQQAFGARPGDPWFNSQAEADAFHARADASTAGAQARDAAMNGGLGAAWISNPGGNPINYSNAPAPAPDPRASYNSYMTDLIRANPNAGGPSVPVARIPGPGEVDPWLSSGPPRGSSSNVQYYDPKTYKPPAAAPGGGGLNFANGTNVPAGAPIAPPGAGGANYALDVNKYLDPSMAFTMGEGLRALGSSASAGGQVNSGQTLRDIIKYSQGVAGQNWNNAAQLAAQQQGFGRGIDVNNRDFTQAQNVSDRDFAYNAQREDQTIPFNQQMQLAQLGMTGLGQQASLSEVLAKLQSANTILGGQAAGAGTVGANRAVTDPLSQLIAMMTGNSYMNNFPQFGG